MADPLATLLRLRRRTREAAMQALAAALRQAEAASARREALRTALRREMAAAPRDPEHPLAGALPRWVRHAGDAIALAAAHQATADQAVIDARHSLRRAEAAVEAAEALARTRGETARREAGRRAQRSLDEAASLAFSRAAPPSAARGPCR